MSLCSLLQQADHKEIKTRAWAASQITKLYLYGSLQDHEKKRIKNKLVKLLSDNVRIKQKIAEIFIPSKAAPYDVLMKLAHDDSALAYEVLSRSPALSQRDLLFYIQEGNVQARCAIATRMDLNTALIQALIKHGEQESVKALLSNQRVDLTEELQLTVMKRYGTSHAIRHVFAQRSLTVFSQYLLFQNDCKALYTLICSRNWLPKHKIETLVHRANEAYLLNLTERLSQENLNRFVKQLIQHQCLTVSLIVRALLTDHVKFFISAMAALSGLSTRQVDDIVFCYERTAFLALYYRTELPKSLDKLFHVGTQRWRANAKRTIIPHSRLTLADLESFQRELDRESVELNDQDQFLLQGFKHEAVLDQYRTTILSFVESKVSEHSAQAPNEHPLTEIAETEHALQEDQPVFDPLVRLTNRFTETRSTIAA